MRKLFHIHSSMVGDLHRVENAMGSEWLVTPAVMVREMVLGNELLPFDEILPPVAKGTWEGKPLMLGHPTDENGNFAAAGLLQYAESAQAGRMQNVGVDADLRALVGESWINMARAAELESGQELIDRVQANEVIENSTSYWAAIVAQVGVFDGTPFTHIQRNMEPDHHAVILNGRGRCSIEDGCGIQRVNVSDDVLEMLERRANAASSRRTVQVDGLSHGDRRAAVRTAISEAEETSEDTYGPWIHDMFDDVVVYELDDHLYQREYEIDESTLTVTLGDRTEVVQRTDYVPVDIAPGIGRGNQSEGEGDMDRSQLIRRLAANDACPHSEAELNGYSDPHLQALGRAFLGESGADDSGDGGEGGRQNDNGGDNDDAGAGGDAGSGDRQNAGGCGGGDRSNDRSRSNDRQDQPQPVLSANQIALLERLERLGDNGLERLEALQREAEDAREQSIARLAQNEDCPLERADLERLSSSRIESLMNHYFPASPAFWAGGGGGTSLEEAEGYLSQTRGNAESGSLFGFDPVSADNQA